LHSSAGPIVNAIKGQLPIQLYSMPWFKIHRLRWIIRMPGVVHESTTIPLVMTLSFATGVERQQVGDNRRLGWVMAEAFGAESLAFEIQAEDSATL
jgi:hypothetical protein